MDGSCFLGVEDKTNEEQNFTNFGLKNAKQNDQFVLYVAKREKGQIYLNLKPYGRKAKKKANKKA